MSEMAPQTVIVSGPSETPTFEGQIFKHSAAEADRLARELASTRSRLSVLIGVTEEELQKRKEVKRSKLKALQKRYHLPEGLMHVLAVAADVDEPKRTGLLWKIIRFLTVDGWLVFPLRNRIKEERW